MKRQQDIRTIVGVEMAQAVSGSWSSYQENPNQKNKERYLTWRLRFRLKFNNRPDIIERFEHEVGAGLFDSEVGPLYDMVQGEFLRASDLK